MKKVLFVLLFVMLTVSFYLLAADNFSVEQVYKEVGINPGEITLSPGDHLYIVAIERSINLPKGCTVYFHREVPANFYLKGYIGGSFNIYQLP